MSSLTGQDLLRAHEQCAMLRRMLEEEFVALRNQELERFEKLQAAKSAIMLELSGIVESHRILLENEHVEHDVLTSWDSFRSAMLECRDLHRRNEVLIIRKRDAINGALLAFVGTEPSSSVDVYDRLGRVSRSGRRRAYSAA